MQFEITPRRRRDGFTHSSDSLCFPLWYTTLNGALSYARFLGRDCGCDIRICTPTGSVAEEIKIDGNWEVRKYSGKKNKIRAKQSPQIYQ